MSVVAAPGGGDDSCVGHVSGSFGAGFAPPGITTADRLQGLARAAPGLGAVDNQLDEIADARLKCRADRVRIVNRSIHVHAAHPNRKQARSTEVPRHALYPAL